MKMDEALAILREANVLTEGHFLLTSGRHSDKYLQCAKIFQNIKYAEPLCRELVEKFSDVEIDLVVGPAIGAVSMAYEVGRQLGVDNFFAEREDGKMTFRRGFAVKPGTKVLVVEDVVTTGGSAKEVLNLVKDAGGEVVGVGVIVDRSAGKVDFGCRFEAVISMEVESWAVEECPLCKAGVEITKPGSRASK